MKGPTPALPGPPRGPYAAAAHDRGSGGDHAGQDTDLRARGPARGRPGRADTPLERDAYLGRMAHCLCCHTPLKDGARDYEHMPGAGGLRLTGPWGTSVSANITPDPETGIGGWTDRQVRDALAKGVRPTARASPCRCRPTTSAT